MANFSLFNLFSNLLIAFDILFTLIEYIKTSPDKKYLVCLCSYTLLKGMKSSNLNPIWVDLYLSRFILFLETVGSNTTILKVPFLRSTVYNILDYPFDMNSSLGNISFFNCVLSDLIDEKNPSSLNVKGRD